jgi:hypothetical protein
MGAVWCKWLPGAGALALVAGAIVWALSGLPGGRVEGGDCEQPGGGPIAQPANAWSALALCVVGAGFLLTVPAARGRRLRRGAGSTTPATGGALLADEAAAAALVLAGTGSFLFHAGLTAWSARLDGILVAVVVMAMAVARWGPRRRRTGHGPGSRQRTLTLLSACALTAGAVCWALGRTGGPWCRPQSLLQAHAAWHLLAGAAAGLWLAASRETLDEAAHISPRPLPSERDRP